MDSITPQTFLNTVFPPIELGQSRIMLSRGREGGGMANRLHSGRRAIGVGTAAWYFCISSVKHGTQRRSYRDIEECWVIVCDDIGTKATAPSVDPSYIIETSAGNFQYGYLIDPYDVSTVDGRREVDTVLYSLALAGHNDPGCRNASRIVRLPGSLHKTGFVARVTEWSPDRVWDLEDLLPQMGVEKVYPAGGESTICPGKHSRLADVTDPVYHWLVDNRMVIGNNPEWVHIVCPWRDAHTDNAQGVGDTSFSPEEYGTMAPAFKCLHGHCAERRLGVFKAWLIEQGCPVSWGENDNFDDTAARFAALMGEK